MVQRSGNQIFVPVCESSITRYLCVQGWWGRRTGGRCCKVAWLGAQVRELCRARPGVPAAVGAPVQRGTGGRAPSQPLTVPQAGPAAPAATRARCHQHSQALTDGPMDPARGWRGRKLLIPFYLPLSLLSHVPVMLCVSPGISRSYSCALPAAGGCPASQHPAARHRPEAHTCQAHCEVLDCPPLGPAGFGACKHNQL